MAIKVDRVKVTDLYIGRILARAPEDPNDGVWPHITVRNLIEKLAAPDIDLDMIAEKFSMRGVYCKAFYEGGVQERELARKYQKWAEILYDRWPRMAAILKKIAENYEKEARSEDAQAKQYEFQFFGR
mmetsp:Transcript_23277/g.11217  ORF Transcript_23277/g.11217 Transcript_23277/m.11217 type:complete len:128 (-) Transcript_23277:440-823(-)